MMTARLVLRPVEPGDADLLLRWRNEPSTREQSLDTSAVAAEDHRDWLERKLAETDDTRIWIAEIDGSAVGQARVDRLADRRGVISVSVDPGARGRGVGTGLIGAATERGAAELALDAVEAVVKAGNAASLAAFRRAGYESGHDEIRGGDLVIVLEWSRK